jgi:hypothetical protein
MRYFIVRVIRVWDDVFVLGWRGQGDGMGWRVVVTFIRRSKPRESELVRLSVPETSMHEAKCTPSYMTQSILKISKRASEKKKRREVE